jgi:hypothetical protein
MEYLEGVNLADEPRRPAACRRGMHQGRVFHQVGLL